MENSSFSFSTFKTVSGITEAEEAKYALLLKSIFELIDIQYGIVIDDYEDVPFILQNAIFEHAVFLYKLESKGLNLVASVSDTAGNKTTYKVTAPKEILAIYKMLSPNPAALL